MMETDDDHQRRRPPAPPPPEPSIEVEALASRVPYEVTSCLEEPPPPPPPVATQTPHGRYFDRLRAFQRVHGFVGSVCIRGLPPSGGGGGGGEDEEEGDSPRCSEGVESMVGEQVDAACYTEEDVRSLRYVMLDPERSAFLDQMEVFVLQEQADQEVMTFGASFGRRILDAFYDDFLPHYDALECGTTRFNVLFAYTFQLLEYNFWMLDNEGGMTEMAAELAGLWKALLQESDETLGIDGEYTRPAVLVFLGDFQQEVEGAGTDPPFVFQYE